VVAVAVVLLTGCKVDARVDVTLRADGSGTVTARVTLDADAVRRLTEQAPLDRAVPLGDVRAAGWKVSPWTAAGGGRTIALSRGFTGEADLSRRLEDLVGTTGVLRAPVITRSRGWLRAEDAIAVTVDLRHLSTGIRSDAEVAKRLVAAGVNVDALDAQLRGQLGKALTVAVTVHAPGGQTKTVQLRAGDQATAAASTSRTYARRIVLLAIGVVLLLLAVLLTAGSLASTRRRRRAS
jgi:hypothetical protein